MANKRITELTELSTVATGDYIAVVDVSDTTQSADGTTKKITQANFSTGTFAPVASPTFTGTVTIPTLVVNTAVTFPTAWTGVLVATSGVVSAHTGLDIRHIIYRVIAPATDVATGEGQGGDFEIPITGTIVAVGAYNDTAGITGTATYDIHLNGTTIMSATKISIETTEKSSRNATTQPVLTTTAVTAGDLLVFGVDAVQSGTAPKGLSIRISIRE